MSEEKYGSINELPLQLKSQLIEKHLREKKEIFKELSDIPMSCITISEGLELMAIYACVPDYKEMATLRKIRDTAKLRRLRV